MAGRSIFHHLDSFSIAPKGRVRALWRRSTRDGDLTRPYRAAAEHRLKGRRRKAEVVSTWNIRMNRGRYGYWFADVAGLPSLFSDLKELSFLLASRRLWLGCGGCDVWCWSVRVYGAVGCRGVWCWGVIHAESCGDVWCRGDVRDIWCWGAGDVWCYDGEG